MVSLVPEVASKVSEAIVVKAVADLVTKTLGPASTEIGEWLKDEVNTRRVDRAMAVLKRLYERLESHGYDLRQIPDKVIVPSVEAISLEDDPNLQELWMQLLTSSATGTPIHPGFIGILKEMSVQDAKVLEAIAQLRQGSFYLHELVSHLKWDKPMVTLSLNSLIAKNLCEKVPQIRSKTDEKQTLAMMGLSPLPMPIPFGGPVKEPDYHLVNKYELTTLGKAFLKVVQPA